MEALAKLRTVFKADGTVTVGTSAPLSDGAGFVVLMSGDKVKELGVTPIARFVGYKAVGVDPKIMGIRLHMRFLKYCHSAIYLLKTLI